MSFKEELKNISQQVIDKEVDQYLTIIEKQCRLAAEQVENQIELDTFQYPIKPEVFKIVQQIVTDWGFSINKESYSNGTCVKIKW